MKTYLNELRGQVRGNARLRRRLDAAERGVRRSLLTIISLVTHADNNGYGDSPVVSEAARFIGWGRFSDSERQRIKEVVEGVQP